MKFLRGKIWQIALAICMLVALMCVTTGANAEAATASITIAGTTYEITQGEETTYDYFTTDGGALVVLGGEDAYKEENYNVKVAFNGSDPTVYLKDASISAADVAVSSTTTTTWTIHTVEDSSIVQTGTDASYAAMKISGKFIFTGEGKLYVEGARNVVLGSSSAALEFNNANVDIKAAGGNSFGSHRVFGGTIASIVFDGGEVNVNTPYVLLNCNANITVRGEAKVRLVSDNSVVAWGTGNITVESGYLYVQGDAANAGKYPILHYISGVTVTGGTFEAYSETQNTSETYGAGADILNQVPNLSGYDGEYYAVAGSSKSNAEAYTADTTLAAQYFAIGKKVTVTVKDGTAKAFNASSVADPEDQTIHTVSAIAGVDVTVTANSAPDGKVFAKWTAPSGTFANANATTTFKPDGDVTVTAHFGKQASVTIAGTARTVIQGGVALYFTTNESGAVTPGGDENTYNIKFAYPAEGKPTVFLRGAYINSGSYSISSNANSSADGTVFVVENTKTVTVGEGESAVTVNAYLGKPISWSVGELTVQGQDTGKLKIVTTSHSIQMAGQPLTFKDLNLEITTTANNNGCFSGTPTNLTFDGGKAVLKNTGNYPVYFVSNSSAELEGIVITGGADVWMTSANDTIYGTNDTLALKVYSGKLKIETTSSSHSAVRLNSGTIQINGGTVEFYGPAKATYGTYVPVLTGYRNAVDENTYLAVAGASEAGATTYNGISGLSNYKYFKVEPAYTITVDGGTSSPATKAPEGTTVTLTAPTVTGKVFTGWTVDDGSAEIEIQEDNGVYTFTMPAKNVSVTANYKNQATIKLAGEPYTFSEDRYFTINADGATIEEIILAEGQEAPTNYNIKLAFDDNDIPTVYLKNANLSYTDSVIENGTGTTEFAIETEAPSTLHQTGDDSTEGAQETRGAVKTSGRVIFRGDDLLTLKGNANGMYGSNSAVLLFEGSNVQIVRTGTWSGWYDGALYGSFGEIIFDGGTTEFVAPRFMFYNATTFTIRGGAKLTLSHTGSNANQTTYSASTFNIENGYMYLAANVATAALGSSTINILENGVFEAYNQKAGGSVSTKAPNLFDGYYAVMGASKADVAEYKVADGALSGQYFKAGKAYTVTVEGGTAQSVGAADLTIKAFVGDTVTLIPGEAQAANQRFAGWTFGQGSQEPEITDNVFTMPSGNVTVEATYEVFATMKIMGTGYDFTANGPVYFETAAGSVTKIDPPQDGTSYNIKLALVDGVPTVYLKGAHISDASWKQVIANGTNTTQFAIETEADSRIDYTGNAVFTTGELIFRGTGKLTIESKTSGQSAINAATGGNYDVVFDHANVEIITIGEGGSTINGNPKSVIFNGGSVTMDTEYAALFGGCAGGVQVTNNANVHIEAVKQAFYISSCATITVDSGNLYISSTNNFMYVASGAQLVVNGGAVELISTGNISANASVIINQNYTNALAVSGTSKSDATLFTSGSALSGVSYFKVAPGYDVTVTNGTAKMLGVSGNAIKAFADEDVTLTPNEPDPGKGFAYWTSAELLGEDKNYDSAYTFTMLGKPVAVAASYGEAANVLIRGTTRTMVKGGKPVYLLTDPETGDETLAGADENNYNIMLSFVDDLPTVTLKGATITTSVDVHAIRNGTDVSHLVVDVVSASTITSGGRGFYLLNSDLTIKGSGKLTILTEGNSAGGGAGILFENNTGAGTHTLTFDNANVLINANGSSTSCIYEYRRDINVNINGGTVELIATYRGWDSYKNAADGENANADNNAPTITGDWLAIQAQDPADSNTYWGYSAGSLLNHRYFKVEPKRVEVTITWGAMSFTYTGSIWNVETLKWEGRWEPTVSEDSEAAGMDGYDPELDSNQIKVVNTGTVTVNVSFRFNSDANFGNSYGTVNGAFVTRKPYYFSNWDEVDSSEFPYIWSKAYFWAERKGTDVTVSYNGETSIPGMAAKLKEVFDEYPDNSNMRIMNITAIERRFLSEQTEDVVFMESGVERLTEWVEDFLDAYQSIGGKLDAIHSDLEYINGFYWYLYSEQYLEHVAKDEEGKPITDDEGNPVMEEGNTNVYRDIIENDNYKEKVRPQLKARGFKFETNPEMADFGELYSLYPYAEGPEYTASQRIWDTVIRDLHCSYLDKAFYEPLLKYYPGAYFSDYQSRDTYGWMKLRSENNYTTYLGGNTNRTGHTSSYNAYNYAPRWVTASEDDTTYYKPASYNGAVFEDNAFHMTQWETNNFKSMYAATDTKEVEIALTYYDYARNHSKLFEGYPEGTSSDTPYHIEGYFHAGLLDPEFAGYVIKNEIEDVNDPATDGEYEKRLQVISDIMLTLTRIVGYSDRKPIETPLNWNDSFILSGMYANGRNVWRITPDTISGVSRKTFLLYENENEVVFYNKGQRITFPQGSIIEEPVDISVGTCGYWVETPADVMPIVTNEADRYEEYPAYVETFDNDNYTVGKAFSSQYSHTWESVLQSGASASIQENAGDKVLAIQGNATLNNVKLPEYITAGDNYAKQQAWELSFRLSALPSGNGELKLLTASSGGSNADGGFLISNNKLYYSTASGYQVFNITLDDNTEYTVKRVFDFRTANSFTCSYYVYRANGSELARAEKVEISSLSLPVQKIGISTASFGSNILYVDDYTLNAIGLTNDLEIYRADTGILVDDPTAPQNFDTAYRLSWKNATEEDQCYNVVATFSDGSEKVVESIQMRAGCDGVATGIVEANGGTVRISIEEGEVKSPESYESGSNSGSSYGSNFANGEDTPITLTRFQETDAYLYLSSGSVAEFPSGATLGTVTITINAITPAQEGGNAE